MARSIKWREHGTVERYRQGGCDDLRGGSPGVGERCEACRAAKSAQYHEGRNQPSGDGMATVTAISGRVPTNTQAAQTKPAAPHVVGYNEENVIKQTLDYVDSEPAYVAMAISCARTLDNPDLSSQHATTTRNLFQILSKLSEGKKKKSRGRLAAVQQMTTKSS